MQALGAHNNARLRAFLDQFGFDYEFALRDRLLRVGPFRRALLHMLANYEKVMAIMLPSSAGAARNLFAIPADHPETGNVMQVPIESVDAARGNASSEIDPDTQEEVETLRHRRSPQAAMEAGLGDALVCARHRL